MVKVRVIFLKRYFLVIIAAVLILNLGAVAIATGEPAGSGQTSVIASPFQDVAASDPNTVFIKYISQKGLISGFPDGTYHPAEGLTRAQAAVIICRAAALKTPAVNTASFKDVPLAHWASPYVDAASKAGYIKGFPDGSYQPDAKLTRAQAISLVMRLCTQKDRAALPPLQDMNSGHWAAADMATALALDMVQTSQDGQQIYPDKDMSRAELARALALLLTKDSGLSQVKLSGQLTEIKGEITLTRNNKTEKITKDTSIYEADIIQTGKDGSARIIYPDGSGNLLEENVEIAVKKANGKSYIKQDGTPGVAVDFLNIELKKGTLFGALSTKTENLSENKQSSLSSRMASRDPLRQLAAAETAQPWYKTAEKKKVRMQVDMPWGVAAVRGTFIKVSVNTDGTCEVCCLSGNTDTTTNAGNIIINGGDKAVIKAENSAPEKGALTAVDKAEFAKEQEWVVNTALKMDANRAAEIVVKTDDKQTVEQKTETTVKTVIDALKSSGIQLKTEVIDKLKQDIQAEFKKEAAESLIRDVDTSSKNTGNNNTYNNNNNNSSSSDNSSAYVAYNQAGAYGGDSAAAPQTINGTVAINASGVILHNLIINGNLVLAASIGEGDATLQNVKVTGATTISGGGANSVKVEDCNLNQVTIKKEGNIVHIIASGTTVIGPLTLESGAELEESSLTGTGFSSLLTGLSLPSGTTIILCGSFESVNISAPGLNIQVESGSIGKVNLAATAAGTSLNLASGVTVSALEVNAEGVKVEGGGQISSASINASGVTIATAPASWTVKAGLNSTIGGQEVSGSGGANYIVRIDSIPAQAVQVDKTLAIPITTDPADATVSASVVAGSSPGQAELSLSGKTLSVTGKVYGAVTIQIDAIKAGYTAASTTFTVSVQEKPVVTIAAIAKQIVQVDKTINVAISTDPADATVSAHIVEGSSGNAILSLSDKTLSITGKVYGAVTIQVDAVREGYTAASSTFTVICSNISPEYSWWEFGEESFTDGMAEIGIYISNADNEPINGLNPDQFTMLVDNNRISFAQLPFGILVFNGTIYIASYLGSDEYTFSSLEVGGVPVKNKNGTKSQSTTITGGGTLNGNVTYDSNNRAGVKVEAAIDIPPDMCITSTVNYTYTDSDGNYLLRIPNGDLKIKFSKPDYSCDYQALTLAENATNATLDATMANDNDKPDGITVDKYNSFEDTITLTVSEGPLSDESWYDIFNLIKSHTGNEAGGTYWIETEASNLMLDSISLDGVTMVIAVDGTATITQDFVIPKELVVDRAGHQAAANITIDSLTAVSSYSSWSIQPTSNNGMVMIELLLLDEDETPITDLRPDRVEVIVDGKLTSFSQSPFGGYIQDDGDYLFSYTGNGTHTFSGLKVDDVLIGNEDDLNPASAEISGAITLTGHVKDVNGQPMKDVRVQAVVPGRPTFVVNSALTGQDGGYLFTVPNSINPPLSDVECGLRIVFVKDGYSAAVEPTINNPVTAQDIGVSTMTVDNVAPDAITTDKSNSFTGSLALTASGGPLSDKSWYDIFELIKSNTGSGGTWIVTSSKLSMAISPNGNTMTISLANSSNTATIKNDFIIPKELVVDRAGNPAAADITIDSLKVLPTAIQPITDKTVYIGSTINIDITTDPTDAEVNASVVESSQGQANLSLNGKTLSVTGTVYGAVTIKIDAIKQGYTSASTSFTVMVREISIDINNYNSFYKTATLTASGGPLTNQSWHDIFALIQSKVGSNSDAWIYASNGLSLQSISQDGTQMVISSGQEWATIYHDFIIPANLVVNSAGRHAATDVIIDSYREWIDCGTASGSNVSALALGGKNTAVAFSDGSKGIAKEYSYSLKSWAELGNGGFSGGAVKEIELIDAEEVTYCSYVNSSNQVKLMRYNESSSPPAWSDYTGGSTGTSARLLESTATLYGTQYNEYYSPLVVFEENDGPSSYKGVARKATKNGGAWEPAVTDAGGNELFFYNAGSSLNGLSTVYDGNLGLIVAYLDSANQIVILNSEKFGGVYQPWQSLKTISGPVKPGCGVSLATGNGNIFVAYVSVSNELKVEKYSEQNQLWSFINPPVTVPDNHPVRLCFSGVPCICFTDGDNKITVMNYYNNNWKTVGEAGFATTSNPSELQFRCLGIPYLAYLDTDNKVHLMRCEAHLNH